ncbi:hypothetical protein CRG98_001026 [Punica granatum]|uniref:Uncharacterized protein n=1 Tax=Punica granatum TaxID=22663 RepID=A0A2I0LD93_PUNGR|nr:hypothetical protein CRG98_001026 [Punica granatum]
MAVLICPGVMATAIALTMVEAISVVTPLCVSSTGKCVGCTVWKNCMWMQASDRKERFVEGGEIKKRSGEFVECTSQTGKVKLLDVAYSNSLKLD